MNPSLNDFSRPVAALFIAMLIWQILAALKGGWGTWSQIQAGDHKEGMGIIYHGSIWGDVFLWWVMATIWQRFSYQWFPIQSHVIVAVIIGIVVAFAMFMVWRNGNQLEAHQQTWAGLPLALQLGAAIAITFAFYAFSKNVPSDFSLLVAVLMFVYVFLSSHIVLAAFDPVFFKNKPDATALVTLGVTFAALAAGYVGQQHNWWGWW